MARFLAIDWDQNQLHVVAGSVGGGRVKYERAQVWQEEKSPTAADAEELGRLLRERLKSAGIAPAPVLACLGRDRVIVKDLRFPVVPAAEEPAVVRFQAAKELRDAAEEVVIDYVVYGASGASEQQALALIVRREIVGAYQKLCQAAGLKLAALTPRPFGVAAALRKAAVPPEADEAVAVVVVGERWAEFCVLRGQVPLLARPMNVGPGLAGEVRRNLTVYAGQAGRPPIRSLYLAGGGPALREQIGERIDVPMQDLDPLNGAALDVPAGSHGAFVPAAGLLCARAESRGLPINFVQPREPKPVTDPNNRRLALVGLGLAVAFVIGVTWCTMVMAGAQDQAAALRRQSKDLDDPVKAAADDAKRIAALDSWDSPVWLDELYDLTARIPDVNALRITQAAMEPLARTGKDKYVGRITLKGNYYGDQGRKALDDLIDGFKKDGYYSPEAPKFVGNQFTLSVKVERRPPDEYKRTIPPPKSGDANR